MIPFFDTHTHILPSVDDGAKSKTEAVDRYALEADTIAPLPAEDTTAEAVQ